MCVCVSASVCINLKRELASKLLDVVKVATVVNKISYRSFIYSPTTTFHWNITDNFTSALPCSATVSVVKTE